METAELIICLDFTALPSSKFTENGLKMAKHPARGGYLDENALLLRRMAKLAQLAQKGNCESKTTHYN